MKKYASQRDSKGRFIKGSQLNFTLSQREASRRRMIGNKLGKSNLGKKLSKERIEQIRNTTKIGELKYWLGKKRLNMSNEKHPLWKGDKVSYGVLHKWVTRKLGSPKVCSNCKTTTAKKFEWANISKEYKRELTDWIRLCTSCHHNMDGSRYKEWETRRKYA